MLATATSPPSSRLRERSKSSLTFAPTACMLQYGGEEHDRGKRDCDTPRLMHDGFLSIGPDASGDSPAEALGAGYIPVDATGLDSLGDHKGLRPRASRLVLAKSASSAAGYSRACRACSVIVAGWILTDRVVEPRQGLAGPTITQLGLAAGTSTGPRIESGNPTGRLPLATDCSLRGEITLEVTESSFLIIDRAK